MQRQPRVMLGMTHNRDYIAGRSTVSHCVLTTVLNKCSTTLRSIEMRLRRHDECLRHHRARRAFVKPLIGPSCPIWWTRVHCQDCAVERIYYLRSSALRFSSTVAFGMVVHTTVPGPSRTPSGGEQRSRPTDVGMVTPTAGSRRRIGKSYASGSMKIPNQRLSGLRRLYDPDPHRPGELIFGPTLPNFMPCSLIFLLDDCGLGSRHQFPGHRKAGRCS
jgi:hypothetical protein